MDRLDLERKNYVIFGFVCLYFFSHVFAPVDNGKGAEVGRRQHPCLREEQEGVHRADGEVEDRKRSGPADRKPGQRLLRGPAHMCFKYIYLYIS